MTYYLGYSPLAEHDLAAAYAWYMKLDSSVANRFKQQVEAAIQTIQEAPLRWAIWRQTEYRRYLLPTFPYILVYGVVDRLITIVSVLHQRQDPSRRFPEDP